MVPLVFAVKRERVSATPQRVATPDDKKHKALVKTRESRR